MRVNLAEIDLSEDLEAIAEISGSMGLTCLAHNTHTPPTEDGDIVEKDLTEKEITQIVNGFYDKFYNPQTHEARPETQTTSKRNISSSRGEFRHLFGF